MTGRVDKKFIFHLKKNVRTGSNWPIYSSSSCIAGIVEIMKTSVERITANKEVQATHWKKWLKISWLKKTWQKFIFSGVLSNGNLCRINHLRLFGPHTASIVSDKKCQNSNGFCSILFDYTFFCQKSIKWLIKHK